MKKANSVFCGVLFAALLCFASLAAACAEHAVGYNADMGVPSGAGAVKHTAIEEFYDLADVLNEGQETPAWEHKTENALPTLISQRD